MVIRVATNPATPANMMATRPNRVPVPLGSDKSPIASTRRVWNDSAISKESKTAAELPR